MESGLESGTITRQSGLFFSQKLWQQGLPIAELLCKDQGVKLIHSAVCWPGIGFTTTFQYIGF